MFHRLDAALDLELLITQKYTGYYFFEEAQGLSDASGVEYEVSGAEFFFSYFCSKYKLWVHANVGFLVSDTGFSGRISVFWRAGTIFLEISICPNKTCKNFENRSTDKVFMVKMNFE